MMSDNDNEFITMQYNNAITCLVAWFFYQLKKNQMISITFIRFTFIVLSF